MSRLRSVAMFAALVGLAGCYSYRAAPLAAVRPRHEVRVTTRDGRRVELGRVTVAADTLRGRAVRQVLLGERRVAVTIAVAELTQVEVRRVNVGRSFLACGALAALVVIPALAVHWDHLLDGWPIGHW